MNWKITDDGLKRVFIAVIFCGLLLRVVFSFVGYFTEGPKYYMTYSDSFGYATIAKNILDGNGFSMSEVAPFESDSIRLPGYPIFVLISVALTGSPWFAIFIQIILGALTPILIYEILRRLNFNKEISLVSSLFIAFEPLISAFSAFLTTESIFLFVFSTTILFYLRFIEEKKTRLLFVSSVLFGISILLRPIALYALFIFALHLTWESGPSRRRWILLPVFLGTAFLILSPWMYRNYRTFGSFAISAVPYYNAYVWHGGSILAVRNGSAFDKERERLENVLKEKGFGVTSSLSAKEFMKKEAKKIARDNIGSFFKLDAYNSWKFFTMDGYYDLATHLGFYKNSPVSISFLDFRNSLSKLPGIMSSNPMFGVFILGRAIWIVLLPIFLIGVIISLLDKKNRNRDALLLGLILYFMTATLSTGFGMNARFRVPVSPFYIAYCAIALFAIKEASNRHIKRLD